MGKVLKSFKSWNDCIYYKLIELGRNINAYDDEHSPLSLKTVQLAIILAEDFDCFNAPIPTDIYVDYFGSIVFEREVRDKKIIVSILPNGSVEYLALGFPKGARRKMVPRCKTGEKDYWSEWINEALDK